MNVLKKILAQYERVFVRIIQIFLLIFVFARWIKIAVNANFMDYNIYIQTAKLIRMGISPYEKEVYDLYMRLPPLQPPSMSLLFMLPSLWSESLIVSYLYFTASIIAFLALTIMILNYYGYRINDYIKPKWKNLPIWLVFMLISVSNPFLHTLFIGQSNCFAILFLFSALLFPKHDKYLNIFFLGMAAAVKYSIMTFLAPVLIFQKRLKMSILGFIFFMVMVLSVGFWLNGPIPSFVDYIKLILYDIKHGANSYENNAYEYICLGFFKIPIMNTILKILVLISYGWILYKKFFNNKDKKSIFHLTAIECCLFSSMTLCISYHRLHDGILFLPFLAIIVLDSFYRMSIKNIYSVLTAIVSFSFFMFWCIPYNVSKKIAEKIGALYPSGADYLYYAKGDIKMFPLLPIILLMMICFLFLLEKTQTSDDTTDCKQNILTNNKDLSENQECE
ncbi:MAG: DUF2029 domain-containing protein [Victivallales bacterium]|nr:DUF2029 domain-containing protein [Victivallales bacterium]